MNLLLNFYFPRGWSDTQVRTEQYSMLCFLYAKDIIAAYNPWKNNMKTPRNLSFVKSSASLKSAR